MTFAAVISGGARLERLDATALDRLQWEQFQHDERYHREIARLSVQDRLKHMALHFAKYAGNLIESQGDESKLERIVTDIFIIATSAANTLNIRLATAISERAGPASAEALGAQVTIFAGRMAAACEKTDHLEDYPFRKVISEAVVDLAHASLFYCKARGWEVELMVTARLQPIKEKSIFYGKL